MSRAVPRTLRDHENLKFILDRLKLDFDVRYIDSDPIRYVHRYSLAVDQECVAFLVATVSFGQVKSIFSTVEKLLSVLSDHPVETLLSWSPKDRIRLNGIYHRWITAADFHVFFLALSSIYREGGTLERFFQAGEGASLEEKIHSFSRRFREKLLSFAATKHLTRGVTFMIPSVGSGSVMKRFNMFLRWVVRTESPDLGLWQSLEPSELFMPMDTHLIRMTQYLGMTQKSDRGWKMVRKATKGMRRYAPRDPVGYDFSLCRLGILGRCKHRFVREICADCPLREHCRLAKSRLTRMTR